MLPPQPRLICRRGPELLCPKYYYASQQNRLLLVPPVAPCFPFVCFFNESFQVRQTGLPEHPIRLQPRIDGLERCWIQFVNPVPSLAALLDQVGTPQQSQMLRDRRSGYGKFLGNTARGLTPLSQQIEHSTPRRISQGLESSLTRICNRTVPHNA